jgi:chromosome segregation ATPase
METLLRLLCLVEMTISNLKWEKNAKGGSSTERFASILNKAAKSRARSFADVDALTEKLANKMNKASALYLEVEKVKSDCSVPLNELKPDAKRLEEEKVILQQTLDEAQITIKKLRDIEIPKLRDIEIPKLELENRYLKEDLEEATRKNDRLKKDLEKTTGDIKKESESWKLLNKHLDIADAELFKLKGENQHLSLEIKAMDCTSASKISGLKTENSYLKHGWEQAEERLADEQKHHRNLMKSHGAVKQRCYALMKTVDESNSVKKLTEMQKELDAANEAFQQAQEKCERLAAELDKLRHQNTCDGEDTADDDGEGDDEDDDEDHDDFSNGGSGAVNECESSPDNGDGSWDNDDGPSNDEDEGPDPSLSIEERHENARLAGNPLALRMELPSKTENHHGNSNEFVLKNKLRDLKRALTKHRQYNSKQRLHWSRQHRISTFKATELFNVRLAQIKADHKKDIKAVQDKLRDENREIELLQEEEFEKKEKEVASLEKDLAERDIKIEELEEQIKRLQRLPRPSQDLLPHNHPRDNDSDEDDDDHHSPAPGSPVQSKQMSITAAEGEKYHSQAPSNDDVSGQLLLNSRHTLFINVVASNSTLYENQARHHRVQLRNQRRFLLTSTSLMPVLLSNFALLLLSDWLKGRFA